MPSQAWQRRIQKTLDELSARVGDIKVAIVGVGHELYGDDAVGVEIARRLLSLDQVRRSDRLILMSGPAPESFCGVLRRFGPHFVILIDAAEMGLLEGSVRWLDWERVPGWTLTTRSYPLHLMASYLAKDVGSVVGVLGVQPSRVTLGSMSPNMEQYASEIAAQLHALLRSCERARDDDLEVLPNPQRRWIKHGA